MASVGASPAPDPIDPKPGMAGADSHSSSLPETSSITQNSNTIPDQNPSSTANYNPDQNPNISAPALTPLPPGVSLFAPSFRPLGAPQFSAVPSPNPNFSMGQATVVQPPGVANAVTSMPNPTVRPVGMYQALPGQPPLQMQLQYGQVHNAHMQTPGAIPPQGGFS